MTMVHKLRSLAFRQGKSAGLVLAVLAACWLAGTRVSAEPPPVHYQHGGNLPPGAIGSQQLLRGGPLPGYFQPVEIKTPPGAKVSLVVDGAFETPQPAPLKAAMLIGAVYRLRVSKIPLQEGLEVFPTIEVIDRLYPPLGQEFRFPIPVEFSQEELEMALEGKFVTRVVYLEEPDNALPIVEDPKQQTYFEVPPGENPLDAADRLGRPMAILRIGGRVPDGQTLDAAFIYNSPPLLKFFPKKRVEIIHVNPATDPDQGTEGESKARGPVEEGAAPALEPTTLRPATKLPLPIARRPRQPRSSVETVAAEMPDQSHEQPVFRRSINVQGTSLRWKAPE